MIILVKMIVKIKEIIKLMGMIKAENVKIKIIDYKDIDFLKIIK